LSAVIEAGDDALREVRELYPGEVIASGTVGNGCGLEHARFLKHGDAVELEVEKIAYCAIAEDHLS
jgi:2-keto-4-pentenoate hydratase/2-oxohepta-3-ene-1,7-dioic acid hydratase in catechol pathway